MRADDDDPDFDYRNYWAGRSYEQSAEELAITRQADSTPRVETNPPVGDSEPFGRGGGSSRAPALAGAAAGGQLRTTAASGSAERNVKLCSRYRCTVSASWWL